MGRAGHDGKEAAVSFYLPNLELASTTMTSKMIVLKIHHGNSKWEELHLTDKHRRHCCPGDKPSYPRRTCAWKLIDTTRVPRMGKSVSLLLDEMHVKEDLVFHKHTGRLYFVSVLCTVVYNLSNFLALGALMGFAANTILILV